MFVVCKFDFVNGHTFICKVEDVDRGMEIANALMTSRFDENAVYTEEDFEKLREEITKKVRDICADLAEGKIDIHPMKTGDRSACTYCNYKGICRFDTVFEGCSYNII